MGNSKSRQSQSMAPPIEITGELGEKGMFNSLHLHHCFLNVVIQSLWHIDSFRERFIRLPHHAHQQAGLTHDYVGIERQGSEEMVDVTKEDATPPSPVVAEELEDGEIAPASDASSKDASSPSESSPEPATLDSPSTCVCCALKLIFIHYEHSDAAIIPPDTLRFALSLLLDNKGGNKFALRAMSDAEEALDEILKYLHWDHIGPAAVPLPVAKSNKTASEESEISRSLDVTCTPTCISHKVFGNQMMDQKECTRCHATSDPEINSTFLYRIYVTEIVKMKKLHKDWPLETILKANYLAQDYSCPSPDKQTKGPRGEVVHTKCLGPAKIQRWVLNMPDVFAMMCVWSDAESDRSEIQQFFSLIPQQLHLDKCLQVHSASNVSNNGQPDLIYAYNFLGMILYYGRHYVAIFYSQQFKAYVMFDDKRVTLVGNWLAVIDRCTRGKLQPTVLFYSSADPEVGRRLLKETQTHDDQEMARKLHEKELAKTTAAALVDPKVALPPTTTQPTTATRLIPVPPPPVTQSSTASSSSSASAPPLPPRPDPRIIHSPPAIVPDYYPAPSAPSTTGEMMDIDEEEYQSLFVDDTGLASIQPSASFGFASPSFSRVHDSSRVLPHWICSGCQSMYTSSLVPIGSCPTCTGQRHLIGTTTRR